MPRTRTVLGATALLLVGLVAGCTGGVVSSSSSSDAAPARLTSAPAPTVTETATSTATVTADPVTTEVVPASCLEALDAAEAGLNIAAQLQGEFGEIMAGPVSDALLATAVGDTDAMAAATEGLTDGSDRVTALGEQLDPAAYNAAAATCRAAA